ncbi:hypothetical protein HAX54_033403, partial [Datura stramonium]|nr:hypothetical protein [Datura stramonium]
ATKGNSCNAIHNERKLPRKKVHDIEQSHHKGLCDAKNYLHREVRDAVRVPGRKSLKIMGRPDPRAPMEDASMPQQPLVDLDSVGSRSKK